MGTNYYLHKKDACPTCGHQEEPLHIGKSSAGWCFSLAVYVEDGIHDLKDWLPLWLADGACIRDEDGGEVTPEAMLDIITNRANLSPCDWSQERLDKNHAQLGPCNLLRHRIAPGDSTVSHGAGTWDCVLPGFS